uniref:Uncharacterized protein n=1 Tax=Oryza sativa subsp. japonica TaxID=39947 RepID=Q6H843_ORYSJ|nr:unknown protein [Oryza sativa Japonica Group]BAD25106.1 unknown protein [Oryza sativa Japonica Group]
MGAARRLRFGLRAPAASAMSVLLLLLPSSLSLALSPPPPPPFFPPQWAPPVAGGGGPFAGGGGYGSGAGGGGPGGVHEPPISYVYNNPYIPIGKSTWNVSLARPQDIASQSKGLFGGALNFEKQLFGSQLLRIWKSSET